MKKNLLFFIFQPLIPDSQKLYLQFASLENALKLEKIRGISNSSLNQITVSAIQKQNSKIINPKEPAGKNKLFFATKFAQIFY